MNSPIHRGHYLQRGRGLGGIFSALFRVLKPLISRGASSALKFGKHALKDPEVKKALHKVKGAALKSGARTIAKRINNEKRAIDRAKKRVATAESFGNAKKQHTDIFS